MLFKNVFNVLMVLSLFSCIFIFVILIGCYSMWFGLQVCNKTTFVQSNVKINLRDFPGKTRTFLRLKSKNIYLKKAEVFGLISDIF